MVEAKSEDLWNPYRDLYTLVNRFYSNEDNDLDQCNEFEGVLRRTKQSFISLLHHLPKNNECRESLKKAMEEGKSVRGAGHQILSKELYQEAVILSDMYDLNEYAALDLLCTAQIQTPYHLGLPRGLVAVSLYYEARKFLVSTLRILIQARRGVSWCVKQPAATQAFVDRYTDDLADAGLFGRIFELLKTLDLTKEMEMLQANLALGGPRHRRQVADSFNAVRTTLAECVFLWAAQGGLSKQTTVSLLQHLKDVKVEDEASGKLDNVTLYLVMAFIAAVDLSVLHVREDGEEQVEKLPVLRDKEFVTTVLQELSPPNQTWSCEGLQSVALFAFAVCLSSLRLVPQSQHLQNAIEYEDEFVDAAIVKKVFDFMTHRMMENDVLYAEELVYRRVHYLFTNFIVQMYPKVKDLRLKADETSRTVQAYLHEGLELPGNLPRYFEHLLTALAKLYGRDPLGLQLMLDYWSPTDAQSPNYCRAHPRFVSLSKFIRLAGDMLPPTLFVRYVTTLASLSGCQQAARNCFNMLKQPTGLNNVTWDHFFSSFARYYAGLKQGASSNNETAVYLHSRMYAKGIVPQEIEGLHSVLRLIRAVAENDEFSRLALCEHPGWSPLTVLLGLVSCSIPMPLKADLLLTLAALCRSPEVAAQMWANLEASQILVTVPSASSFQPRGVQTELDEVESRHGEYPLTRALLTLLDTLTDFGIPRTLGAGPRPPGFDPYLTFILNSVFLKFDTRTYKDPAEKWLVAAQCLKLFAKFVGHYVPQSTDFPDGAAREFNAPPGFHLTLQLHAKSELFNGLQYILSEGNRLYDGCAPFDGERHVADCTTHALSMLERCLELQPTFFALLSASNCSLLPVNLKRLLLTINPRTGRPDYIVNILKYVGYREEAPRQALLAVRVAALLAASPVVHGQTLNVLLTCGEAATVRDGFVRCLDASVDDDDDVIAATKKAIFGLFHVALKHSAPNLCHFLFGFDIPNVAGTKFQLHGPRTCLHAVLAMIRRAVQGLADEPESLVESAYRVLHALCSDPSTAEPVFRVVRMQPRFFADNLRRCRANYARGLHELNQLSWMLRIVAVEVRLAHANKQLMTLRNLAALLLGLPVDKRPANDLAALPFPDGAPVERADLLARLIAEFDFDVEPIAMPDWAFFEYNSLEAYLESCQTDTTPKMIDIERLHANLMDELTAAQGSTALGQRQAMTDEIRKVLLHALNVNNQRRTTHCTVRFVDAWRQATQVIILYLPNETVPPGQQVLIALEFLDGLLGKAARSSLAPDIADHLSSTALVLLDSLRRNHEKEARLIARSSSSDEKTTLENNTLSVRSILANLVEWIVVNGSQKTRVNLYASLATLLRLVSVGERGGKEEGFVSRLDSSRLRDEVAGSFDLFSTFGDKLVEVLCRDGAGTEDVCNMLAMSCFSLFVALSGNANWIRYMSSRGYLKHLIDGVLKADADLRSALDPAPDNLKALYLYAAKLSFLSRVATTKVGAELLLEQRALSALANVAAYDYHPQPKSHLEDVEPGYPASIGTRYLQIWKPPLYLCNAVLTSLGTDNRAATSQILNFLLSHADVVELVLRSGSTSLSVKYMFELALLTSLLARTATNDLVGTLEARQCLRDGQTQLYRLQRLALALVPRFVLTDAVVRDLLCEQAYSKNSFGTSERLSLALETAANLLMYAKNVIKNHGVSHDGVGAVFRPSLDDDATITRTQVERPPSLGAVVRHLVHAVAYHHKEKGALTLLGRRLTEVQDLGAGELGEYVDTDGFDVESARDDAACALKERFETKRRDMAHCAFLVEHCTYVLWAHLDYYMLKAIPKARNFGLQRNPVASNLDTTLASASEAMWKISTDDISHLKQGLVSVFNDSFCRQLVETSQGRSDLDANFLEVLLRKIKRLIQFVPVK